MAGVVLFITITRTRLLPFTTAYQMCVLPGRNEAVVAWFINLHNRYIVIMIIIHCVAGSDDSGVKWTELIQFICGYLNQTTG